MSSFLEYTCRPAGIRLCPPRPSCMVHSTGLLSPESRDGLSRTHCTRAAVSACTMSKIKFNPFLPIHLSLIIFFRRNAIRGKFFWTEFGNPIAELRTILTYVVGGGGGGGDDFGYENSKDTLPMWEPYIF
jgi:hypothetical protein